jgi:hypothetical protein
LESYELKTTGPPTIHGLSRSLGAYAQRANTFTST